MLLVIPLLWLVVGHWCFSCNGEFTRLEIDGNILLEESELHRKLATILNNNEHCNQEDELLRLEAMDAFRSALIQDESNMFNNDNLIEKIKLALHECNRIESNKLESASQTDEYHVNSNVITRSSDIKLKRIPTLDFALHTAGSTVIQSHTSPTYFPKEIGQRVDAYLASVGLSVLSQYLSVGTNIPLLLALLGINPGLGEPQDALTPKLSLGSCWPMQV